MLKHFVVNNKLHHRTTEVMLLMVKTKTLNKIYALPEVVEAHRLTVTCHPSHPHALTLQ